MTKQQIERPSVIYLKRTDAIVTEFEPIATELRELAGDLARVEATYYLGQDVEARRRDPVRASEAVDEALALAKNMRLKTAAVQERLYELGLRLRTVGDAGVPGVTVTHAATGRTYTYESYHRALEQLFRSLAGVYYQHWTLDNLEEGELPPFTGEESRLYIAESGKPIVVERAGEQSPITFSELEQRGVLRSPYQLSNYLEAVDAYLAALEHRMRGERRVEFYQVTPFRNINRPDWPWQDYDPLSYWVIRITRNYALEASPLSRGASYVKSLDERLEGLAVHVRDALAAIGEQRTILERARGRTRTDVEGE